MRDNCSKNADIPVISEDILNWVYNAISEDPNINISFREIFKENNDDEN